MVGDEILRALCDPGEIADAELVDRLKRRRKHQAGRIGERPSALRRPARHDRRESSTADRLRLLEVKTEEFATVIGRHQIILTSVDVL
jgi:hypothetical protein